jgi:flavin reductase (DIM6/NTAB) family NADH-FMN oxidoreductase RutF
MSDGHDEKLGLYHDFAVLEPMQRYKLLSSLVVPRPIAWVTTHDLVTGIVNAAPYSFFNVFCEEPALVILGLQHDADSVAKDTARNIRDNGEFVVNLVRESSFEAMVSSAAALGRDISEPSLLGLETAESQNVSVPRLADTPAALECRHERTLTLSRMRDIVIGEVVGIWSEPGLVNAANHHVDWKDNFPVGRLYADRYSQTRDSSDLRRSIPPADSLLNGKLPKRRG